MNLGDWDQRHRTAYGEDAWDRVQRLTWTLTRRYIGWHDRDFDRYEAEGDPPDAVRERRRTWMPASRLVALALWRAARAADVLVDDIPLNKSLWWLGGREWDSLFAEPLPPWRPALPGSWQSLQNRADDLVGSARTVPVWHAMRDMEENRPLADTDDSTGPPPLLLADRVRAVEAGPFRDGTEARWHGDVEHARRAVKQAEDRALHGVWAVSDGVREAARQLMPTLRAEPDSPPAPDHVTGHTWIQRLCRLAHIRGVIETVLSAHDDPQLTAHPRYPAGTALRASVMALNGVTDAARDLEALWAADDPEAGVAAWERAHIPVPLREHIRDLEEIVRDLAALCIALTHPNEPH